MKTKAVLLLGSNCTEKKRFIELALNSIATLFEVKIKSSLYQSPAWGYQSKNKFINLAVVIECNNSPDFLLCEVLKIEEKLGRKRSDFGVYQDRCIDIDIILFGAQLIDKEDLVIPHPRMHKRRFCLLPLNEIIPNYLVPGLNKTVNQLLSACEDNSKVICLV